MDNSETRLKRPKLRDVFFTLGILTIVVLTFEYFEDIFKPIVIAALFWFIIKELKNLFGKIKFGGKSLPGFWRGILALIIIVLSILVTFELLSYNAELISQDAPAYKEKLYEVTDSLSEVVNDPQLVKYIQEGISKINFAGIFADIVNSLSGFITSLIVVLVYVIFLIIEESLFSKKVNIMYQVKGEQYNRFLQILQKIDRSVRSYLSNMVVISFITAIVSYVALLILDVDYPILWAYLVFILNFVPYIGPFVSSFLPAVLAVVQFGSLIHFVYVFATLEIIQFILGNFVQPRMMGKSMNISALTVLVALAFWGSLWGVEGMVLAVPIASISIIIMYQFPETKNIAIMLSEKGEFSD